MSETKNSSSIVDVTQNNVTSKDDTVPLIGGGSFTFNKKYLIWGAVGAVVVGLVGFIVYKYLSKNKKEDVPSENMQDPRAVQQQAPPQDLNSIRNDPRVMNLLRRDPELRRLVQKNPMVLQDIYHDICMNDKYMRDRMQQRGKKSVRISEPVENNDVDEDEDSDYEDLVGDEDVVDEDEDVVEDGEEDVDDNEVDEELPEGRAVSLPEGRAAPKNQRIVEIPEQSNDRENERHIRENNRVNDRENEITIETPARDTARDISVSRKIEQCVFVFQDGRQCDNEATQGEYCIIHI